MSMMGGSTPAGQGDPTDGLLRLLSDPKAVAQNLADLQTGRAEYNAARDVALEAQRAAQKLHDAADQRHKDLDTREDGLKARGMNLDKREQGLAARDAALVADQKGLVESQRALAAQANEIGNTRLALEREFAQQRDASEAAYRLKAVELQKQATAQTTESERRKSVLDARDAKISEREIGVAKREADVEALAAKAQAATRDAQARISRLQDVLAGKG